MFQILVASVCAKAPRYDWQILYDFAMFFSRLRYAPHDFPLRVVFQLLRFKVGDLELDQLVQLASVVLNMPQTQETLLLMEGVKCLINGWGHKIDTLTLGEKILLFDIFCEILEKDFAEELLQALCESVNEFDSVHVAMALSALSRIPYRCAHKKELLFECIGQLDEHFPTLTSDEALDILDSVEEFKQKIFHIWFLKNN